MAPTTSTTRLTYDDLLDIPADGNLDIADVFRT
jgi:hypothetical protein